jgi:DegV family protein with EDD domain
MKYGIVVDSSCDLLQLPAEFQNKIDYSRASLKLDIGEQVFVDNQDLDIIHFMKEMYAYKGKTGSAAPSPEDFLNNYKKSDNVIVLTITGALSGTYSSAKTAEEMFKEQYPDRNIYVLDTKTTGPEMTLLVKKICQLITAGVPFEEIITQIEHYKQHTHLIFILSSLENLIKNGRISRVAGGIASVLGIKLYAKASEEGTIQPIGKCRGKLTAYNKSIEEMFALGYNGGPIVIAHCLAEEIAQYISDKIHNTYPNALIDIMPTGGLCSYYAEQGGILIGFETGL